MSKPEIAIPELTPEQEKAIAVRYLQSLEPGFLPGPIYAESARLTVKPTVEVGFVRPSAWRSDGAELILTQRPADDENWPSQWHVPGSNMLATDPVRHEHDHDAAIARVLDEVGGDVRIIGLPKEYDGVRRKGSRGSEHTVRFIAMVRGEPKKGRFFDMAEVLKSPPAPGLVETHGVAIAGLARAYSALRSDSLL